MAPPGSLLGNAVRRVEDPDILFGRADYVDDLDIPGVLHLVFVRSTVAHADLLAVDMAEAAGHARRGRRLHAPPTSTSPLAPGLMVVNPDCARPPLAKGKVRFVGDIVAVVVAESRAAAVDAAELVVVDYEPLPAVVDPEAATEPGAPLQFEALGTNVAAGSRDGRRRRPAGRRRRGRAGPVREPADGRRADGGQRHRRRPRRRRRRPRPHRLRRHPDAPRLAQPGASSCSASTPTGCGSWPPTSAAPSAARPGWPPSTPWPWPWPCRLGRPVKWVESRSENLVAMPHGRGQVQYVELGLRRDGTIVGLRCRDHRRRRRLRRLRRRPGRVDRPKLMAQGPYRIPRIGYDVATVVTNTTPDGRLPGRRPARGRRLPGADHRHGRRRARHRPGRDPPPQLPRRPTTSPTRRSWAPPTTAATTTPPSTEALRLAGYDALRAEQAERRRRGDRLLLGIGLAAYVEVTAGGNGQRVGRRSRSHADGTVTVKVGTSAHGQGHATAFAMLVADRLGVPLEAIRFVQSDTAVVPTGRRHRRVPLAAARRQRRGAARPRPCWPPAGPWPPSCSRPAKATSSSPTTAASAWPASRPGPCRGPSWPWPGRSRGRRCWPSRTSPRPGRRSPSAPTWPWSRSTSRPGSVRPVRHVAVDDCGRVLNPLLVAGQQHGGIAQGIGQALWEAVAYDEDGNPLTATLADYGMPSAAELPSFEAVEHRDPHAAQPPRRQGHRRVGDGGVDARRPERGGRRPEPPRRAPPRHAAHAGAGLAGDPRPPPMAPLSSPWREPPAVFDGAAATGDDTLPSRSQEADL